MNIRLYRREDKAACIELFRSNMPKYFATSELPDFEQWLDALDAKEIRHKDPVAEQYFVAEIKEELVGCGGYAKMGNEVTLTWGMVSQTMHGKGLGKALLQYRLDVIRSLFPSVAVILDTTQFSYGFFEHIGFEVTGIIKDFYGPGLDRYDMKLIF